MTKQELKIVLDDHELWIDSHFEKGARADLSGVDLTGAIIRYAKMPEGFVNERKNKVQKVSETDLSGP